MLIAAQCFIPQGDFLDNKKVLQWLRLEQIVN